MTQSQYETNFCFCLPRSSIHTSKKCTRQSQEVQRITSVDSWRQIMLQTCCWFFILLREFRSLFTCWVVSTIPKIRSIIMLKIIVPFLWWNSSQHLNHGPTNCCSSHLISGIENFHSEFADYTVASSIWCWRSDKLCWLVSPSFKAWVVILVCQQTNIQNCPRSDTSWWEINSDGKSRELTKVYLSNVRIDL